MIEIDVDYVNYPSDKEDVSLSKALNEKLYTQSPFTSQQSTTKALYQCLNCQHEWTGLMVKVFFHINFTTH